MSPVLSVSLVLYLTLAARTCLGRERVYYLACGEEVWDYAPGGGDRVREDRYGVESDSSVFLEQSSNRIGSKYKKAIYREYTDNTYRIEKPKQEWLGFLGPIMKAEVGDSIIIHFWNNASRDFSVHPHGVAYTKASEGALYKDGFHTEPGAVDLVQPGGHHTYNWTVQNDSGPASGDPDCVTWLYHSHVSPSEDISSGVVGFLLTCRTGRLPSWELTRQYALYVAVVDENLSWYLDDNINLFTDNNVDKDDEDFQESNKMHAINGYVYGHLAGLSACVGETIHWHMASLGTEVDVHAIAVSGHSFEYFNHRTDSIRLTVAHFVVARMEVLAEGRWLMRCQVNDHISAGMEAYLNVEDCNLFADPDIYVDKTRRYYIAAEETLWDYAPSGRNKYDGGDLTEEGSDSEVFFLNDTSHIGGVYKKALFREYTDFRFQERKDRGSEEEHLGFLGPVIRAEVGDQIKVVFYNKASRPFSVHAHGVQFSKFNEGSLYKDESSAKHDDAVQPQNIRTYYWIVTGSMGPTVDDPPCITRMYTSGVDVIKDSYSGLVGPLLICRKGSLDSDGRQVDVAKEFFLLFSVTDENKSWYLDENMASMGVDKASIGDDFEESNLMHGINGRLYGNLDGLDMCAGDSVAWHVFSVGTEVDLHTLTFNGNNFMRGDNRKLTSDILPGNMKTLSMTPAHAGSWGLLCETNDHYVAGTKAIYNVEFCDNNVPDVTPGGATRRFYIQAKEEQWNYVPFNRNIIKDKPFTDPEGHGAVFAESSATRIGGTYLKALYREYTDDTFTTLATRPADEQYLGMLGPIIRVEVGDDLEIVFKNGASRNYSVKAQGLYYDKGETSFKPTTQPSVAPGSTFTYTWKITERSGPGPRDPDCITSIYYSDVDPVKDVYSGLIGPLIVCRRGSLVTSEGSTRRTNVDKDFAVYFSVIDENQSWYLQRNVELFTTDQENVDLEDDDFIESNLMHAINGYLYGNQAFPTMMEGNTVDWYLITTGTEVDMHSVHFHGNDLIQFENKQHANDVTQLFPSVFITSRMHAVNVGKWLYHCHVHDHILAGMQGIYDVQSSNEVP